MPSPLDYGEFWQHISMKFIRADNTGEHMANLPEELQKIYQKDHVLHISSTDFEWDIRDKYFCFTLFNVFWI